MTPKPDGHAIVPVKAIRFGLAVALTAAVAGYAAWHLWRTNAISSDMGAESKVHTTPAPEPGAADHTASGGSGAAADKHKDTNGLIHETSPYLLQHSHNPVHWYPWGTEALTKAEKEDKPIFLSIGYSTCYWCHVMEKECFEDEEVAQVLNEHFIAIKVDREERPDIDEQYMLVTQLITGRGGWPNSVWLTPNGRPWMAGTYFPKNEFIRVLNALSDYWKNRRQDVEKQADQLARAVREAEAVRGRFDPSVTGQPFDQELIDNAVSEYRRSFDAEHGGFGRAPKFPPHGGLLLIANEYRRTQEAELLRMITRNLDAMLLGGIHDHIGGGFHRYSTDSAWLVPHYEKMLYDNAQLIRAYTDGYLATEAPRYREAVEDIFSWLKRDMTSPHGGFYSALDAGEVGKEGETYLWQYQEIIEVLGEGDGALTADVYNIRPQGNFREEASGEQTGRNIAHLQRPLAEIAGERNVATDRFGKQMAELRGRLLARRNTRDQPRKDDKILTSWNGLTISALAYAGHHLREPRYTDAAAKAAEFCLQNLVDGQGRLLRTFRAGQAKLPGYLDDYAYLVQGLLDLHAATGQCRWLDEARRLADIMLAEFEDKHDGAFYFTTAAHEDLLVRSKNLLGGGNVPVPNGVAALALMELGRQTGDGQYDRVAQRTLNALTSLMRQSPRALDHAVYAAAVALRHRIENRMQAVELRGADASKSLGPVTAHLFVSRLKVQPGQSFRAAVALDVAEGWHLYGPNPNAGYLLPTTVSVTGNEVFAAGEIIPPEPHRKQDPTLKQVLAIYRGRVWFFVPLEVRQEATEGRATLKVQIKTQACDQNRCLAPRTDEIEMTMTIAVDGSQEEERHSTIFEP